MNKLKMESVDMTRKNIDVIAELFPQVVTEVADPSGAVDENGKPLLRKAIDFEKLKLVLSAGTGNYVVADDERERYEFTWVGKRQAMIDAATPIRKTLRPCPEESKNWETTENLYIEGDNLEVLKLLQESYLGKVKMIYIDPPYNTGNDFIYKDNFAQSREEYEEELDRFDEEGNRLFQNTETNGRFHSDWCSMIYPRLQLARNLLTDDGAIFISIGDDEESNLIKICDEIFGEHNFIASICHKHRASVSNDRIISENHNHLLFYAKNIATLFFQQKLIGEEPNLNGFNFSDENGAYKLTPVDGPGGAKKGNPHYEFLGIDGYWRYSKKTMQEKYNNGLIVRTENGLQQKYYLKQAEKTRQTVTTWWDNDYLTSTATKDLSKLMGGKFFDNPKSVNLLLRTLRMLTKFSKDSIILDFFSGSATTAHAVMQLNAEDGGNRKFIMVQLPEVCDPNSEAAKAGYKTICEIGKERIRRAGDRIKEENKEKENIDKLDTGFRVFKLDSTNMKDVYYAAGQLSQKDLWDTISNIKDDRSDIDLLYGCLLDWGVQLTMPHTTEKIEGFTVHTVDSPLTDEIDLIACFDSEVSEAVVRTIAKRKPTRALFRDSSFADSADKINVFEIFKSISPDTTVKVI
ncbi:MAG: site-specific DNA-methyltransferase [Bacteroidales bacterium]|nr:site-specific DNA-methyltransferase [Bacteroidales bacterium]